MLYVFGHRNPDSDSICTTLVAADWLASRGVDARPFALGKPGPETDFILDCARMLAPELLTESVAGKQVYLIDFSELEQGPPGLPEADVVGLIDHHRLGTLMTKSPIDATIRPYGASATVLLERMGPFPLTRSQARLLLGALLSDTLNLTSPTTTEYDRQACETLTALADIDVSWFAKTLLQRRTALAGYSLQELLESDEKCYAIAGRQIGVAQIFVVDDEPLLVQGDALEQTMAELMKSKGMDGYVLMITNLERADSRICCLSSGFLPVGARIMKGMLSRKMQLLPWLTELLSAPDRTALPAQ